jgi:hypothetical protein
MLLLLCACCIIQVASLSSCFAEHCSGSLQSSSALRSGSSSTAEFLKVLLTDVRTRFSAIRTALHAVIIGGLSGRRATHCLSEVRMLLAGTAALRHRQLQDLTALCLNAAFRTDLDQNQRSLLLELVPSLLASSQSAELTAGTATAAAAAAVDSEEDDSDNDEHTAVSSSSSESVTDSVCAALTAQAWPPGLALPLLVLCEDAAALLPRRAWSGVRVRLLQCIATQRLDSADYAGVARQLLALSQLHTSTNSSSSGNCSDSDDDLSADDDDAEPERARTAAAASPWLQVLCKLYAAAPALSLSTLELVVEQALRHAEHSVDALLTAVLTSATAASSGSIEPWQQLNLLLLLLRVASPLQQCCLPLLPPGLARSSRVEAAVRTLLLTSVSDNTIDTLLQRSLALAAPSSAGGSSHHSSSSSSSSSYGGSSSSSSSGSGNTGAAAAVSERAAQLLELAFNWLDRTGIVGGACSGSKEKLEGALTAQQTAALLCNAVHCIIIQVSSCY